MASAFPNHTTAVFWNQFVYFKHGFTFAHRAHNNTTIYQIQILKIRMMMMIANVNVSPRDDVITVRMNTPPSTFQSSTTLLLLLIYYYEIYLLLLLLLYSVSSSSVVYIIIVCCSLAFVLLLLPFRLPSFVSRSNTEIEQTRHLRMLR